MLKQFLNLLSKTERKYARLLVGMMIVVALLDMIGVASILPFMAVIVNPDMVHTNPFLKSAFIASHQIGINTPEEFIHITGFLVFILLLLSLTFKAITSYMQTRFTLMREYSIGKRIVEGYLHQPYTWFLNRHSADLGKTILSEVAIVISSGFNHLMLVISQSMVALALLGLLLIVDPMLAIVVGMVLGLAYIGIFLFSRNRLKHLGEIRSHANHGRFTSVSEVFGAIKEVKMWGLENVYLQRFAKHSENYASGHASAQIIGQLPRFAIEAIAFGGLLLMVLYLLDKSDSYASTIPVIALYAFSGYRLMPALQQIYNSITQLRFVRPALEALNQELMSLEASNLSQATISSFPFSRSIELKRVSYRYPNAEEFALKNINLIIPANNIVGFTGSTGSGKTTIVDIILGLLVPQEGSVTIDGELINASSRHQWQSIIGYVPQSVYLIDASIEENIAFGSQLSDVDQEKLERAAKIADLHEFVVNDLPQGYATNVGERGIRLSGGQRQRIAIARALYHNPKILIFDEATSALDNLTEKRVMENVSNLCQETTIILIAHRLTTLRNCDQINLIEEGSISASGTY